MTGDDFLEVVQDGSGSSPLVRRCRPLVQPPTALTSESIARACGVIEALRCHAPTPLRSLGQVAGELGLGTLHLKDESERCGIGSFKALGATYALITCVTEALAEIRGHPVATADIVSRRHLDQVAGLTAICASDGNHGRAVAFASQRLGCRAVIYLPPQVSPHRRRAIQAFGGEVVIVDGSYDDAVLHASKAAAHPDCIELSDTAHDGLDIVPQRVMQGYGVMIDEIARVAPTPFTHVFLQAGVGGMAAAVLDAAPLFPALRDARGIVVESDQAACLLESARFGRMIGVTGPHETVMGGLACGVPSTIAYRILRTRAQAFMAIDDAAAKAALRRLAQGDATVGPLEIGESGVAGLAGLFVAARDQSLRRALALNEQSRVLVIGTEGITDPRTYARALEETP